MAEITCKLAVNTRGQFFFVIWDLKHKERSRRRGGQREDFHSNRIEAE